MNQSSEWNKYKQQLTTEVGSNHLIRDAGSVDMSVVPQKLMVLEAANGLCWKRFNELIIRI